MTAVTETPRDRSGDPVQGPAPAVIDCWRCGTKPSVGNCCSSHNKPLCHLDYRRTHFVEVCVAGCSRCAAEGLPLRFSEMRGDQR